MLKKLAAGEILGESVGVCVWLVVNGLGDVRLMALPGCKVTGSKLVRALIVMTFKKQMHDHVESAENKCISRHWRRQTISGAART